MAKGFDIVFGDTPTSVRQALLLVLSAVVFFGVFAGIITAADGHILVGVLAGFSLVPAVIYTGVRGVYFTLVLGHEAVPAAWRRLYTGGAVLVVWLAWLSLFARGDASVSRHTLDAWSVLWRAAVCLGVFGLVRGLLTERRVVPRLKAYVVVVSLVGAFVWLSANGVFSGPPEDDPFDVAEPLPPQQARDQHLFLYVSLSLAALAGVARSPRGGTQS